MKFLKLEKKNKISYVSFKRTKSLNALNSQTLKELIDLNKELESDSKTKVVVYRSEGKNFSAGADIKEKQKKLSKLELWKSNLGKEAIESILNINQITIASLRGYCLGGAACIASACDFRIASETTLVAYPEIDLGMNLNWFGLPLLLRLIGPSKTKSSEEVDFEVRFSLEAPKPAQKGEQKFPRPKISPKKVLFTEN